MTGDTEAGTQFGLLLQDLEPFPGILGQPPLTRDQQVSVGALMRAPDSTAQLVELGQTETVGPVDNDGIRCRDIDTVLNDRRTHQQIGVSFDETKHDLFQLFFRHLAMTNTDFRLGNKPAQEIGHGIDRLHPVVNKINLATATQFAQDRVTDQVIIKPGDVGSNCLAINRWRVDNRQFAQTGQTLVQGARYRCRG